MVHMERRGEGVTERKKWEWEILKTKLNGVGCWILV
jgi:hypothetical protein